MADPQPALRFHAGRHWYDFGPVPAAFRGGSWITRPQRQRRLIELQPAFTRWTNIASNIWVRSEVITMLFNHQRRSTHDFIARTIVINERT